jgi:hypothetical protein
MSTWKRHSYVTPGADPTQVVQWGNGSIFIAEFQGIYRVAAGHRSGPVITDNPVADILGAELHKSLERIWEDQQLAYAQESQNFDALIYGGK